MKTTIAILKGIAWTILSILSLPFVIIAGAIALVIGLLTSLVLLLGSIVVCV